MSNSPGSVTVALDMTGGGVAWSARGRPALLAGDAAYYQRIGNLLAAPPNSMIGAPPDLGGNVVAAIGDVSTPTLAATLAAQAAAIIASDNETLNVVDTVVTQIDAATLEVAAFVRTTSGLNRLLVWPIA